MDPVKPAGAQTGVQSRVKDWLQYAEELGLGPYYRDRHAVKRRDSVVDASAIELITTLEISSAQTRLEAKPAAQFTEEENSMPPTKVLKSAAASFVSPAHAETLFGDPHHLANDSLPKIREDIGDCTRCKLSKGRTKIVFGTGNPNADLMFVGEAPGRDEDLSGEPFVGRAGKLLTDMIKAMGLQREDVYIANVVKCRPPENRLPEKDEITTCSPFLMRQIDVIKPKVICTLGSCSAQMLLQTTQGISKLRGEWFDFRDSKLMPTYHPAYLLRNPGAKPEVWKDLQKVMAVLGLALRKKR
jgi:uracil-DNA glycosylase family 4